MYTSPSLTIKVVKASRPMSVCLHFQHNLDFCHPQVSLNDIKSLTQPEWKNTEQKRTNTQTINSKKINNLHTILHHLSLGSTNLNTRYHQTLNVSLSSAKPVELLSEYVSANIPDEIGSMHTVSCAMLCNSSMHTVSCAM